MSNTAGTIIRVGALFTILLSGWFLAVAALYALFALISGYPYEWPYAQAAFCAVVIVRMFYPRNVFAW